MTFRFLMMKMMKTKKNVMVLSMNFPMKTKNVPELNMNYLKKKTVKELNMSLRCFHCFLCVLEQNK
jgi:hypothetical protein